MNTNTADSFDAFSPELIAEIFSYLPVRDVCQCSLVSQQWGAISSSEHLWRNLCKEAWKGKKGWSGVAQLSVDQVASTLISKNTLPAEKLAFSGHASWKLWFIVSHKDSQRTSVTTDDVFGDWILHIGINQKCDPIRTRFESDFSFFCENTGALKWEVVGNTIKLPDSPPPLRVKRTANWGWKLHCPYSAFYQV
ncbi:hypothetical protein K493DRAFT_387203 [Basidiobolus meristosporus CBS 931.73]|uniref:F-box domain-containing protein n=1 Tax=Basidiobolus meristosporus CBS 931.73 TaxID=1314790 RepID=A0A1Y1XGG1_9FUNG|nr:hypothetical protein K493DRAFT_387203 [Basidiobolus meristosporus CBS 931.73]|eukprot:ORX84850.1 hypothetical protein K493DRAFT_387203 [Basidiobolus meristosporus CBS 931.73]